MVFDKHLNYSRKYLRPLPGYLLQVNKNILIQQPSLFHTVIQTSDV